MPFILIRQYGLLGYIRLFKVESTIIEKKEAAVKVRDLRVTEPWTELEKYAMSFDLASLEEIEFNHVPFACILIQAVEAWRSKHSGDLPKTFPEKKEFQALLNSMRRPGAMSVAENIDEAIRVVFDCYKTEKVATGTIRHILDDPNAESPSTEFWLFVAALKTFE